VQRKKGHKPKTFQLRRSALGGIILSQMDYKQIHFSLQTNVHFFLRFSQMLKITFY